VGTVHAPGEAITRGGGEHLVFNIEAPLLFAEGRLRKGALPICLERPEIVIEARHQRHVPRPRRLRQAIEQVADHGRIDPNVLGSLSWRSQAVMKTASELTPLSACAVPAPS
jgi:hypothetical protein